MTVERLHLVIALFNANFPLTSSQSIRENLGLVEAYYFDLLVLSLFIICEWLFFAAT